VECNQQKAKPAREVKVGDMLVIKSEVGEFTVEVLGLSEMRGPAAIAQGLYRETEDSLKARTLAAEIRKAGLADGTLTTGRPNKKDRRDIQRLRGR
jgi:ribosome-associated heat shock protein Hsp15